MKYLGMVYFVTRSFYLSILLVWYSYDCGVYDVVGSQKPRLENRGRHLIHPKVDQVIDPLHKVDDAVAVVEAQVAGSEEPFGVKQLMENCTG